MGGIAVVVIESDLKAVIERIADDLGIVGGLVVRAAVGVNQGGKRARISEAPVEAKGGLGAGGIEAVEIIIGDGVAKADNAHAAHLVITLLGEHDGAVGIIGPAGEKKVALHDAVVAVAQRELAVGVEKRVVAVGVLSRLVGANLGLTGVFVHPSAHCLKGVVEGVVFHRGV